MNDTLPASAIPAHDDPLVVRIREGLRDHVALHHRRDSPLVSIPRHVGPQSATQGD